MTDPIKASQALRELAGCLQEDVADDIRNDPAKAETAMEVLSLFRTLAKVVAKLSPKDVDQIIDELDEPEREIIKEKLRWL